MNDNVHPILRDTLNSFAEIFGKPRNEKSEVFREILNDFESKDFFATLETHFNPERLSNCCGAPVAYDSDICSDCGEHCALVCPECNGEGQVLANYQGNRTDPLYTRCENCKGSGEVDCE